MGEPQETYDVVVVGAGPAGLTAGMYCARQGLRTAIVAGEIGGQAAWAGEIGNYMGWQLITGPDLIARFREHVSGFGVECHEGKLVNAIVPSDGGFEVYTREGDTLPARTVVIATGRAPNRLAVPGEQEFVGRGVSYCATCDASFFAAKPVAVVGPGDAAAEAALELADLGASVTVLSERELRVAEPLLAKMEAANGRIERRGGVKVTRIDGDDRVTGVTVRNASKPDSAEETLAVDGVFIETGSIPVAEFTAGAVETNDRGEIVVDDRQATSVPGIFAAGDVASGLGKQIIIAAGTGARAAVAVSQYLKHR